MESCLSYVKNAFSSSIKSAFPLVTADPIIAPSSAKFGGDYQCNSAMSIFKQHGKHLGIASPKQAGDLMKEHMTTSMFSSVTVSNQGFVTVKISSEWLSQQLQQIASTCTITYDYQKFIQQTNSTDEQLCRPGAVVPPHIIRMATAHIPALTVAVDFSSPNIAKEMHVGHLRSTIIGECMCRVLSYCGHVVHRINHVGDWGTQFGMLIEYMKEIKDEKGESSYGSDDVHAMSDLQGFYRASKLRFDEDSDFKRRAQQNVVKLQSGDEIALKMWQDICEVSRLEFKKVYDRLDVRVFEKGESFYNNMLPNVVEELENKGLVSVSDGAKCVFTEGHKVPLMVVKSDGGYGYDSTDLAAIRYRLLDMKSDWLVYVVDAGQEEHFTRLFAAAAKAGWHLPPTTRVDHTGFGVVQGEDGKKFKTRSGDVVKLVDLLDEAATRALAELRKRREQQQIATATEDEKDDEHAMLCGSGGGDISDEEMKKSAEAIGYSAVKYFDLKQNRTTNYKFSYDKMLDPKGNTAVYMLYAYARICAVFRKCGVEPTSLTPGDLLIEEEAERSLCVLLLRLPEVIDAILTDLHVHRLAEYMYDLSDCFTTFYQNCRVIGSPQQNSRLLICYVTKRILEVCFFLLGIRPLERI
eukprot:GHVS01059248.1.p1 GENE.GHVS01059248.1~~GHVS01059248.1.p1  ORF type:complete len:636 (+),score=117.61 GHVS01059248.1:47-1954(+)